MDEKGGQGENFLCRPSIARNNGLQSYELLHGMSFCLEFPCSINYPLFLVRCAGHIPHILQKFSSPISKQQPAQP